MASIDPQLGGPAYGFKDTARLGSCHPALVRNAERGHHLTEDLGLIGRTFASGYARITDGFDLPLPLWTERQPGQTETSSG